MLLKNKEQFDKIRLIFNIIGGVLEMLCGLLYVLLTDIIMANASTWLFISMILAIGSGGFFLAAAYIKHKKKAYVALRSIGALLSIGFIVFLFVYLGALPEISKKIANGVALGTTISIVCIILAFIAAIFQVISIYFDYVAYKKDVE